MKPLSLITLALVPLLLIVDHVSAGEKKLQIGVKKRIPPEECKTKSKKGDKLEMHYTVSWCFRIRLVQSCVYICIYIHVYACP